MQDVRLHPHLKSPQSSVLPDITAMGIAVFSVRVLHTYIYIYMYTWIHNVLGNRTGKTVPRLEKRKME